MRWEVEQLGRPPSSKSTPHPFSKTNRPTSNPSSLLSQLRTIIDFVNSSSRRSPASRDQDHGVLINYRRVVGVGTVKRAYLATLSPHRNALWLHLLSSS